MSHQRLLGVWRSEAQAAETYRRQHGFPRSLDRDDLPVPTVDEIPVALHDLAHLRFLTEVRPELEIGIQVFDLIFDHARPEGGHP